MAATSQRPYRNKHNPIVRRTKPKTSLAFMYFGRLSHVTGNGKFKFPAFFNFRDNVRYRSGVFVVAD